MTDYPKNLLYTEDHEWIEDETSKIGITKHAANELGDIVYIDHPEVGSTLKKGEAFGTIESTKTVSDLHMPVSGEIIAVNDELENDPSPVNNDPYNKGWIIKIKRSNSEEKLLSYEEYQEFIVNND